MSTKEEDSVNSNEDVCVLAWVFSEGVDYRVLEWVNCGETIWTHNQHE